MTVLRKKRTFGTALAASLHRNEVALISLAVALFGITHSALREQAIEKHRNVRSAGFMLLDQLGQLQEIADRRFYGGDRSEANRLSGWGKAAVVRDESTLLSATSQTAAAQVFAAWQQHVDDLETGNEAAESAIAEATQRLRTQVLTELRTLE